MPKKLAVGARRTRVHGLSTPKRELLGLKTNEPLSGDESSLRAVQTKKAGVRKTARKIPAK